MPALRTQPSHGIQENSSCDASSVLQHGGESWPVSYRGPSSSGDGDSFLAGEIRRMTYSTSKHRRCQVVITVGIVAALVAHYAFEFFFPNLRQLAPLVGAIASLLWVWIE